MNVLRLALLGCLAVGLAGCSSPKTSAKKEPSTEAPKDQDKKAVVPEGKPAPENLQGYWALNSFSKGDVHGTMASSSKVGLTIKGNQAEWTDIPETLKPGKGTVSVDTSKTPHRIDLNTGEAIYKGVYEVRRNVRQGKYDYLVILFSPPGADYPKEPEKEQTQPGGMRLSFSRMGKDE
jgi:uncharacterized protein (TIGR03067 family)